MNICLLSLPRSGTRYLSHLISLSPAVKHFMDEPFNITNDDGTELHSRTEYVDLCKRKLQEILAANDGVLIKDNLTYYFTPSYAESDPELLTFVNSYTQLLDRNFVKIKLIRDNIFDQALSNCVLIATNVWVTYHYTPITQCYIELEQFKSVVELYYYKHQKLSEITADYVVKYDDITGDYNTDWRLLGHIPKPDVFVNFGGIPNHPKQQTVINYRELYEWFQDNKSDYVIDF